MKLKNKKKQKIVSIAIAIILLISIYLNTYLIFKYDILPIKYLLIYFVVVGLIPFSLIYLTVFRKLKKYLRTIILSIEVIYIIILFVAFFYLNQTFNFIDDFTSGFNYETKNYYVVVKGDSELDNLESLDNKNIGYSSALDKSSVKAIDELTKNVNLETIEVEGIAGLIDKLFNSELDSILMIQSYYDMFAEEDENFKTDTKIIHRFSIKEKVNEITKDSDVTKEPFNIYISGIDSYGSVTDKTRSDVNIVMSINPVTYQILMINIPRDYYVTLDGYNQKDKLTHAGMYGVETSVGTIENLLDIEINYYMKLNYNALVKLVNALGGVEVYSNYDFYSVDIHHHFRKGYNKVNGDQALDFVRTRKAFLDGDRVRGENQVAMIKAVINKASSPSILTKYDDLLEKLSGSFTTNMSTEKLLDFVKLQLDKMPNWNMVSLSVNGGDSYGLTYTYPHQELYVMVPYEETIDIAKEALNDLKKDKLLKSSYEVAEKEESDILPEEIE